MRKFSWRGRGGRELRAVLYLRVSTADQGTEQQLRACQHFCQMHGWRVARVAVEKASAWRGPRPVWEGVKREARQGKYQAIVVFRLDRAWRRLAEFILDWDEFHRRGVALVPVMEGLDTTTPLGRAMVNVLVALAEFERTAIAEATRERLQALKNMGKKLGRPLGGSRDREVRISDEEIYARWRELGSIRATARALGISHGKVWTVVRNPPGGRPVLAADESSQPLTPPEDGE